MEAIIFLTVKESGDGWQRAFTEVSGWYDVVAGCESTKRRCAAQEGEGKDDGDWGRAWGWEGVREGPRRDNRVEKVQSRNEIVMRRRDKWTSGLLAPIEEKLIKNAVLKF